jgi:cytochrome c556
MFVMFEKLLLACLLPVTLLAACNREQDQTRYSTLEEEEERVAAMYAMRAIGVELVDMFDSSKLQPSRIRELTSDLVTQAEALPRQFKHSPDPKGPSTTAARALIWTKPDDFRAAMSTFQLKAKYLKQVVNGTSDSKLESIWPVLVDTGNSCTACHQKFRIGGDPPHD